MIGSLGARAVNDKGRTRSSRDGRFDDNLVLRSGIVLAVLTLAVVNREAGSGSERKRSAACELADNLAQTVGKGDGAACGDLEIIRFAECVILVKRNRSAVFDIRRPRVIVGVAAADANVPARVNDIAAAGNIG